MVDGFFRKILETKAEKTMKIKVHLAIFILGQRVENEGKEA